MKEQSKESLSLREGMRKMVLSFLKEGIKGYEDELEGIRKDIRSTQKEMSAFLSEVKKTQDTVHKLKEMSEKKIDEKFIEELSRRVWEHLGIDLKQIEASDIDKVMREIGVIKTRLQWLERALSEGGASRSLNARVAKLEAEIASLRASSPTVIE